LLLNASQSPLVLAKTVAMSTTVYWIFKGISTYFPKFIRKQHCLLLTRYGVNNSKRSDVGVFNSWCLFDWHHRNASRGQSISLMGIANICTTWVIRFQRIPNTSYAFLLRWSELKLCQCNTTVNAPLAMNMRLNETNIDCIPTPDVQRVCTETHNKRFLHCLLAKCESVPITYITLITHSNRCCN